MRKEPDDMKSPDNGMQTLFFGQKRIKKLEKKLTQRLLTFSAVEGGVGHRLLISQTPKIEKRLYLTIG